MLKQVLLSAVFSLGILALSAQNVPQGFNYQCIVRDPSGNPVANQQVTLLFSIRTGAPKGPVAYSEKYITPTNDYGLVNLIVGQGIPLQGTFAGINWGAGAQYLSVSVETSPNVFDELGASQLMSVPYAIYAETAAQGGNPGDNWGSQVVLTAPALAGNGTANNPLTLAQQGAQTGQVLKWNGFQWTPQDDISDTGSAGGTVTLINTDAGLEGGPITTSGVISLSNSGVAPGQYGAANRIPVISVDEKGRVTAVDTVTVDPGGLSLNIAAGAGIGVDQNGNDFTISNLGDTDATDDLTLLSSAGGDLTGAFNNLQIAPDAVGAPEIADNSVGADELAANSVHSDEIAAGAVGNAELADDAVSNPKLADGAVNSAKLGSQAVTTDKIALEAVGTPQLFDESVTNAKLADGAVTLSKIANVGAANGQILKWNGSAWTVADDLTGGGGAPTNISAGPGISVGGASPNFTITNTGDLNPNDDLTSSSQAGGDIQGVLSALQIKIGAVTDVEIANNAVRNQHIEDGAVTGAKFDDMGALNGQVLKWNGSAWGPADDLSSGINITAGQGIDVFVNGADYTITNSGDPFQFDDLTINTQANGDVLGSFSDLQIRPLAVGTAELAANAVATGNLQNGAVTGVKIGQMSASLGQVLKWNGSQWAPAADGGDNWGSQSAVASGAISGNGTGAAPLTLAQQNATNGQVLKWNGSQWTPAADNVDNWGAQVVVSNATLEGSGTGASPLKLAQQGAATGEVLKWNGSSWMPGADNGDNWGGQTAVTGSTIDGNGTGGAPLNLAQQGALVGEVLKWNGSKWAPATDDDTDTDPQNELQNIQLNGTMLKLTNSGTVVNLDTLFDNLPSFWDVDTSGNISNLNSGSVSVGEAYAGPSKLKVFHQDGGFELENVDSDHNWEFWVNDTDGKMSLFFDGTSVGEFATDGMYTPSDRRLKTDIAALNGQLSKILQLEPVTYRYLSASDPTKRSVGFIAQDVQALFPELVTQSEGRRGQQDHLALNYAGLGVLAIQAVKEQQRQIEQLRAENELLKTRLEALEKAVMKMNK